MHEKTNLSQYATLSFHSLIFSGHISQLLSNVKLKSHLKCHSYAVFVNAVGCTFKAQLSHHPHHLSLGAYSWGWSWEHPIWNARGNLETAHCFLFPPVHILHLTRQLHTQKHPSQSSSRPPAPTPYSTATPPVSDNRRYLHDREADYTAVSETWHKRFPTYQHGSIHPLLHLCMIAWSSKTSKWTSRTKRLPLSLQLWHKQHSFSPVLQLRGPCSNKTAKMPNQGYTDK